MSDTAYQPWRTSGEPVALASDAARQWNDLVEESRRSIAALRELRNGLDERLQVGLKVIKAIDRREAQATADAVVAVADTQPTAAQLAAEVVANDSLNARITAVENRLNALLGTINRLSGPTLAIRRDAGDVSDLSKRGPDPMQHLLGDLFSAAA